VQFVGEFAVSAEPENAALAHAEPAYAAQAREHVRRRAARQKL